MSGQQTEVQVEQTISAVINRCRCGTPGAHQGQTCPQAERVDIGIVSYSHTDPVKDRMGRLKVRLNDMATARKRKGVNTNG